MLGRGKLLQGSDPTTRQSSVDAPALLAESDDGEGGGCSRVSGLLVQLVDTAAPNGVRVPAFIYPPMTSF